MSTVEAAASLFGSQDTGPDPFAVIGNEDADTSPSQYTTSDGQQDGHDNQIYPSYTMGQDASNLFRTEEIPPYAGSDAGYSQHASWPASVVQASYDAKDAAYSEDYSSGVANYQPAQVWSDQAGQWQSYGQSSAGTQMTQSYGVPSNSYDPYTPSANTSSFQVQQQIPQRAAHVQSPYDPYTPVTQTYTSPRAVSVPLPTSQPASSYNPYQPAASTRIPAAKPTVKPSHSYAPPQKGFLPNASLDPPPPPASAAPYRPKVSNAYDPPLPPPRPSKRASSSYIPRGMSPAVGQQTYPSHESFTLGPPPVPPVPPVPSLDQYRHSPDSFPGPRPGPGHQQQNGHGVAQPTYAAPTHLPSEVQTHNFAPSYDTSKEGQAGPISFPGSSDLPTSQYPLHEPHYEPTVSTTGSFLSHESSSEVPTPRQAATVVADEDIPSEAVDPEQGLGGLEEWNTNSQSHQDSYSQPRAGAEFEQDVDPEALSSSFVDPEDQHACNAPQQNNTHELPSQAIDRVAHEPTPSGPASRRSTGSFPSTSPPPERITESSGAYSPYGTAGHNYSANNLQSTTIESSVYSVQNPPAQRVASPGSESVRSQNSLGSAVFDPYSPQFQAKSLNPYEPPKHTVAARTPSPSSVRSLSRQQTLVSDPYAPHMAGTRATSPYNQKQRASTQRTSSPGNPSVDSWQGSQGAGIDPYAPPKVPQAHAGSNGSASSSASTSFEQPSHARKFGSISSRYKFPANDTTHFGSNGYAPDHVAGQELAVSPPTHPLYAPSPSLMGANDPLGRTSSRAPVFSFGFGGKLMTCFHSSSALTAGFDVALASRRSTEIQIRSLHKVIPESVIELSTVAYPGPLFSDPGTPTTGLVRASASSQLKVKKARVIKYLEERAEEMHHALGYFTVGTMESHRAESKLALVRLLKVMVENDGSLSGSVQIDTAVRKALLPRLVSSHDLDSFSSLTPDIFDSSSAYRGGAAGKDETPIAVTTLLPSAVQKIQEFLVRGERRQAYHFALDQKLWAHAMVIASSLDKDAWKEVMHEFLRTELGPGNASVTLKQGIINPPSTTNGNEWLRVAYSLFSGQGAAAVQELVPPNTLMQSASTLQLPTSPVPQSTPMSSTFPSSSAAAKIPFETLAKWPETAATMISSPMSPDWSAAMTALGDYLYFNQWVEAAHACYLLSPQTSPMGGIGAPSARIVLLGSANPHQSTAFYKDSDVIIFSEIVEFALSLKPVVKGQEPFPGLPHLQAYKLVRAASLLEIGHVKLAGRYCEAIATCLARPSPYVHPVVLEQLRGLTDRLVAAPQAEKPGSWIGGKMTKPSLDSIGTWLEGRLTKFIAGEGDPSPDPSSDNKLAEQQAYVGPFSHYSSISSATTSTSGSPRQSTTNLHAMSHTPPPRSGSAMAGASVYSHVQIDRASSAMDYYHPSGKSSPAPRIVSAGPSITSFSQSRSFGQVMNGRGLSNGFHSYQPDMSTTRSSLEVTEEEGGGSQDSGWWNNSYGADSSAPTPTNPTFHTAEGLPASSDGFVSLMDDNVFSVAPSPSKTPQRQTSYVADDDDDDDDLGLSNNAHKKRQPPQGSAASESSKQEPSDEAAAPSSEKPEARPPAAASGTSSGSWFSRFWKRSDTPGPVRASLGEETSFYYDKELKRWVNKKGNAEPPKPAAPPPPPSRAQTMSPARASIDVPSHRSPGPFPPRPASAFDPNTGSKPPSRPRSKLVPDDAEGIPNAMSLPNSPANSNFAPSAPPSRPRSQATKRNVRTRYVDVFQQGNAA